ncbi:hypothetical protein NLU13_6006 [Sarocladium strictum]|uniref:Zn(2)-C6 fungal-type domain-containing protein n=1 Tax=Sarocladium strictum TaxID=5046 RepID=A0AA39GGN4_SARSR|nr:hypothetical protein NLU13_6006 [Sarocladium strictum]
MAPPQMPSPAASAGYGRSCTNCSRAKCKCILRPDGNTCERCHRLRKDCQPMVSSRKRTVKKSSSSRTAQLEEKLDDLVSILRASQNQPASQTDANAQPDRMNQTPTPSADSRQYPSRLDSLATAATSSTTVSPAYRLPAIQYNMELSKPNDRPQDLYWQEPSPAEAAVRLDKFRRWLPYFGFMHLPPEVKAEDLKREKPVLYSVIMDITSMSVPEQHAMSESIRRDILKRMFIDTERSMDLLLALITHLTWAHFNTGAAVKPFIIPYSQLASALIFDLGLNKSVKEEQHFTACFKVYGPGPGKPGSFRPTSRPRTMEERRAMLGFWFLSSQFNMFVGKMDTMKWTDYMDECLEIFEQSPELPTDETLALLVRLQRINDEAQELLVKDAMADGRGTPTYMFRKGLRQRYNYVRNRARPELMANALVQGHLLATEIQIESVGLFAGDSNMPESQRIDGLYATVKAVRAWYDLFLGMPAQDIPGMPFTFFIHFTQTHVVLYKLTISDDPAWDKSYLRSTADPTVYFDRSIERFQQIAAVYPMNSTSDLPSVFTKAMSMVSHLKATWEPTLTQHLGGLPTPESQAAPNTTLGMTPNITTDPTAGLGDPSTWDFGDMGWMNDVFGPWEF